MRSLIAGILLLIFCQGCFVYHYPTTPPLSGTVIDVTTKQPISGATVGFREHESIDTETASDGTFYLQSDHAWRFCYFMPGEFWLDGGTFFVEAPGYEPFETNIYTHANIPYKISQGPTELHRDSK